MVKPIKVELRDLEQIINSILVLKQRIKIELIIQFKVTTYNLQWRSCEADKFPPQN